MNQLEHTSSAVKTWLLILLMLGWVFFKGWMAYNVIGNLGQPNWDYRPIADVPGESIYSMQEPYHPLPAGQHVRGQQGQEENPLNLKPLPYQGVE
jgi:hypothetical protein